MLILQGFLLWNISLFSPVSRVMWKFAEHFFRCDSDIAFRERAHAFTCGYSRWWYRRGVESGSQKARPLTLAATHRVFLPAAAIPPFLSSFVSRPLSPLLVTLALAWESSSSSGRPAAANRPRNICRWKCRDDGARPGAHPRCRSLCHGQVSHLDFAP